MIPQQLPLLPLPCPSLRPTLPCPSTGDRLEVRRYERLSPLQAARRPLADLSHVQRGDCVVSFSRREVHAVRQEIQSHGRERCCVIYGALPPDARQLQASLFNTPRTGEGGGGWEAAGGLGSGQARALEGTAQPRLIDGC